MTEQVVWGKCRNCGASADSPTFRCEKCGANTVELFPTPVAPERVGASVSTHPPHRSDELVRQDASDTDEFWSFVIWLIVAVGAAGAGAVLLVASFFADYAICGDVSYCSPQFSSVWVPYYLFLLLTALAGLAAIISLLRALAAIARVVKRHLAN